MKIIKNKKIKHAIILAAGRGMRLKPFSNFLPKAMMPLYETSLISNGIKQISKSIPQISITVGYKKKELVGHILEQNIHSIINTEGKGNSWWIFHSIYKYINEPVLVMTCDNVTNLNYDLLSKNYLKYGSPPVMLIGVDPIENIEGDFIFTDKNNIITKLSRKKKSAIYSSGIQVINPFKINSIIKKPINDFNILWNNLIRQKKMVLSDIKPTNWFSVDNLENLVKINK